MNEVAIDEAVMPYIGKQALPGKQQSQEKLSSEEQAIKDRIYLYFANSSAKSLPEEEREVIAVLEKKIRVEETRITPANARRYLLICKLVDQVLEKLSEDPARFSHLQSTYGLRTEILFLSYPHMTTCEAYTKTVDPDKVKNREFLKNPDNWIPERVKAQQAILAKNRAEIGNTATSTPVSYVVRGNTASGKSTASEKLKISHILLNVDRIKWHLKNFYTFHQLKLPNRLVHDEGVCLLINFKQASDIRAGMTIISTTDAFLPSKT
ncbi:MAG: hypothetical protein LLG04_03735 [Parachlamydia sp.]|nr:hypothetical protein [Parachlamydia sp.]